MNIIAAFAVSGWQGLLLKIAIIVIVAWGIKELIAWWGITIPRPVIIIAICLISILLIYWLFELFNMLT